MKGMSTLQGMDTYPTLGKGKSVPSFGGYVSSLEGINKTAHTNADFYHQDIDDSTGTSQETRSLCTFPWKFPPLPDASKNTLKPCKRKQIRSKKNIMSVDQVGLWSTHHPMACLGDPISVPTIESHSKEKNPGCSKTEHRMGLGSNNKNARCEAVYLLALSNKVWFSDGFPCDSFSIHDAPVISGAFTCMGCLSWRGLETCSLWRCALQHEFHLKKNCCWAVLEKHFVNF